MSLCHVEHIFAIRCCALSRRLSYQIESARVVYLYARVWRSGPRSPETSRDMTHQITNMEVSSFYFLTYSLKSFFSPDPNWKKILQLGRDLLMYARALLRAFDGRRDPRGAGESKKESEMSESGRLGPLAVGYCLYE
jgi:hypothetical protein